MRISDWSSDVCSSDLICRWRRLWRFAGFWGNGAAALQTLRLCCETEGEAYSRRGSWCGPMDENRLIEQYGLHESLRFQTTDGHIRFDKARRLLMQMGRAPGGERVWQYVYREGGSVLIKKKK